MLYTSDTCCSLPRPVFKMSAQLAKVPFESATINEQSRHFAKLLGKEHELVWITDNKSGSTIKDYKLALVYLKSTLQSDCFSSLDSKTQVATKAAINTLEFSMVTGSIFVETFMNKTKCITLSNIVFQQTEYNGKGCNQRRVDDRCRRRETGNRGLFWMGYIFSPSGASK